MLPFRPGWNILPAIPAGLWAAAAGWGDAMSEADEDTPLPHDLLAAVLERLGVRPPAARDPAGLRSVYGAWCAGVPFDNVRKLVALRDPGRPPLPGITARDFFAGWLAHGAGGTCWPGSNALCVFLRSLGFAARRVAGSMRDLGAVSHASVKVRIDGGDWLVDSSLLTNDPLPLGGEVFVGSDPVLPAEVEPSGGTHVVWTHTPPNSTYLPCRLLLDTVDHAFYASSYDSSRERSPFNQRLYARRNHPGELRVLVGHTRFSRTARGLEHRELTRAELAGCLRDDIGISEEMIRIWIRSGALEASFEEPAGPKPPPVTGLPPSQRTGGAGERR